MNCKIYDGADWVPFARRIPDQTPDLRLAVFSGLSGIRLLDAGTGRPQYRYSANGGGSWSSWSNVDGNYTDGDCSQSATGGTRVGLTFLKVAGVPFNQSSGTDNRIQFRVWPEGGSGYDESPEFVVNIGDEAYVSPSGSDATGNGTDELPWKSIGHALSMLTGNQVHPASVVAEPGTYNEHIVMKDWISICGKKAAAPPTIGGNGTDPTVQAANNATIDGFVITGGSRGVRIFSKSNFTISNCEIRSNGGWLYGGGIYAYSSSNVSILYCTIHENWAAVGGGIFRGLHGGRSGKLRDLR